METFSPGETLLKIGIVMRPHGLRGAFVIKPFHPGTVPSFLQRLLLQLPDSEVIQCHIHRWKRASNGNWIAESPDVDLDRAQTLRNAMVFARATDYPPLAENEVWLEDLMGATVVWPNGSVRGRVKSVLKTPAPYPVLVLKTRAGTETYLPLPQEHFVSFDADTQILIVSTPDPVRGP